MTEKDLPIVPDNMLLISEGLLEDIRHELASISRWYAFEPTKSINTEKEECIIINSKEFLVELNFKDLITKIDKVLDND